MADLMDKAPAQSEILYQIKDAGVKQEKKSYSLADLWNMANEWLLSRGTVKLQEKLVFFQMLGGLINAGISIPESLRMLQKQVSNKRLLKTIGEMLGMIEAGSSLADSLREYPDLFDTATCAIVEAGEKSGKLNEVLKELANQYERLHTLKKRVSSVMTYPLIVVGVMLALAVVVVIFVVPKLEELFGGVAELPRPTQILINMSDYLSQNTFQFFAIVAALIVGFILFKRSRTGKRILGGMQLYIPVVKTIQRGFILSRVSRIFGFLISSGVPIIEALRITADVSNHVIYREKLLLAADDVGKGIMIAENIADDTRYFPQMFVSMIAIGEKSASLEGIMGRIATFYDEELDRKIGQLSKLMEPIILAIMALGAVFMIMAIYLPILQLNDRILG